MINAIYSVTRITNGFLVQPTQSQTPIAFTFKTMREALEKISEMNANDELLDAAGKAKTEAAEAEALKAAFTAIKGGES